MQEEFYTVILRKKLYENLAQLQNDLDEWLDYYNHQRPHSGRYCFGKTHIEIFLESLPLAKQKMLNNTQTAT